MFFRGGDSLLDVVHHVIFIGEWPEETTTVKASARVFVCHLASLINAGCFPSGGHQLWSSHTQVEERRP